MARKSPPPAHREFLSTGPGLSFRGGFIHPDCTPTQSRVDVGSLFPVDAVRWLAIGPFDVPYWNRVKHGQALSEIPAVTQFLLWEREDGSAGILLPLLCGDYAVTLRGNDTGIILQADGGFQPKAVKNAPVAFAATGPDVYALVRDSMAAVAAKLKTFRLLGQKKLPDFVDHLGWCSWDAFYQQVNEAGLLAAFESFKRGGISPGFTILDDGWLDQKDDLLRSFAVDGKKFPNGLAPMISRIKSDYHVKFFGIWHAFAGYWRGVDPKGSLAAKYPLILSKAFIRVWINHVEDLSLVDPRAAGRFFSDFHRELRASGVDMLKVDAQSLLPLFTESYSGRVSAMGLYQKALQSSTMRNFNGRLIHCMSNGLDVAYQMKETTVWRNSDDFLPKKNSSAQQTHIHTNALCSLWTGTFSLPDWDMFQTHHRYAEFHAAGRALSGGPVYVCDKPKRQNFRILRQLATEDGRVWRCDRPALPAKDSIFTDCRNEAALLKIHNCAGGIGLLGMFHCSEKKSRIRGSFSPADIPEMSGNDFIARRYTTGRLERLNHAGQSAVELPRMGFEIISVSPVLRGWIAPLGRTGRYVGSASISKVSVPSATRAAITVRESGDYLFWCSARPVKVEIDDTPAAFRFSPKDSTLKVTVKSPGVIRIWRD